MDNKTDLNWLLGALDKEKDKETMRSTKRKIERK